ncbi:alcohol dehydrogenase catalytic domain-containing protein [Microbacterium sp.]|uniref:alcohol dehydrogenase catalytic domain-containing protein n=1 Tax=Microbacterium sp. TaxID=51671 RepID=UPI00281284F5|nr:zinc-binding dehydrogenase [Microbacterium sp.]
MERHWIAPAWGPPQTWRFVETEPPPPGPGEVTIRVRAAGVNPADAKHVAAPRSSSGADVRWPVPIGYEVSGVIEAIGPSTGIITGEASVGDEVIAFRVRGGYATALTVPADKVLHKPSTLTHAEAANLLLAGTTAAEMLAVVDAAEGETVLLHAASGAVGASVLQQAALRGVTVIGTASPARFDEVRRFGGIPVAYGPGLSQRVRDAASQAHAGRLAAALDAAGTDEAVDVSLELIPDRGRVVTVAAAARAAQHGFHAIAGSQPDSARFRDAARARLVDLAERGLLTVPLARTFPLAHAPDALGFLGQGHPGGKLALIP